MIAAAVAACTPVALTAAHRKPTKPKVDVALGESLFVGYCADCHMLKAASATRGVAGPNLDKYPPPSLAYTKYQITHGGGIMPAFTVLTQQQVADLATFVWTKRQH